MAKSVWRVKSTHKRETYLKSTNFLHELVAQVIVCLENPILAKYVR